MIYRAQITHVTEPFFSNIEIALYSVINHSYRFATMTTRTAKRPNPLDRFARQLKPGRIEWIGLRPERKAELVEVDNVLAVAERGLEGDHRMSKTPGSGRQITIISREFIEQIEGHLGKSGITPNELRRNIVVSGVNLNALRRQRFWLGNALIEATALCHPCSRMESTLGPGGVAAMIGYGGLCAKIIETGNLAIGDAVRVADIPDDSTDEQQTQSALF